MPQARHVRRHRIRHACCGERIAPTANGDRRKCAIAVISIGEIVRCAQYMPFGARCIYATPLCAAHGRCATRARISIPQNVGRAGRCVTVESGIRSRAGMHREQEGAQARIRPG
ncbi:hypothetical protein D1006_36680 [Burkholderia stabilis]|uniref:Uncharacterized protein n=1 Tax=Burkholderia stabilis TaxID=95485 RepID=A0A4Q2A917_9BURK|nr:hypothetical protein D1006_36680 [Burkholderia stabilis]